MKRFMPLGMALIFLPVTAGLGYGAAAGAETFPAGAAALVTAYLAWLALETLLVTIPETGRAAVESDRGTLELYAFARGLTVVVTFLCAVPASLEGLLGGAALFLAGVTLRAAAIHRLGGLYSHRVRIAEGQPIMQDGVYAHLRHPAYAGMLAAHLGLVAALPSLPALALWGLVFVPAVVARILVEERHLLRIPGYADYARGRRRLLPGVW